jgi:response regulator RpfG family c-di-GMP phosphodiesterase
VEARRELELGAGTQFDPELVDVFLRLRVSRLRRAA